METESYFDNKTKIFHGTKVQNPFTIDSVLGNELLKQLDIEPERVFQIIHEENYFQTAKCVRTNSIRFAQHMIELGIQSNDVVGIVCQKSKNVISIICGCIFIGAPLNPLHCSFPVNDIKQMFKQTKPKIVFCDDDCYAKVNQAMKELSNDAIIVTLLTKIEGVKFIEEFFQETGTENEYVSPKFAEKDPSKRAAMILCTSGTTGEPKGCILSETRLLMFISRSVIPYPYKSLNFSPIFWGSGMFHLLSNAFRQNDTIISTTKDFSVENLVELTEKYRVNMLYLNTSQLIQILDSPFIKTDKFSSVMLVAVTGSVVPKHIREKFRELLPKTLLFIMYGMTELVISMNTFTSDSEVTGHYGKCLANLQIKVMTDDETCNDLGEPGEICVKPEFEWQGYYNNPDATKEAFTTDGFIKTGDIGYLDSEGNIFIKDRKKDFFKCNRFWINPSELEDIIQQLDDVETVCVVGIPNAFSSEDSLALVVKKPNSNLTEQKIIDLIATSLPPERHLTAGVKFVSKLPFTIAGKLKRGEARRLVMQKLI